MPFQSGCQIYQGDANGMLINLLLGLLIMECCLLLQSLLVVAALRYYAHRQDYVKHASLWLTIWVVNGVMVILVAGNVLQVTIWALLFRLIGEFSSIGEAFYHSAVNFSTLGYGDIVMSKQHKILGPMEAINGVLMIGVSTAALMGLFRDAMKKTIEAKRTASRKAHDMKK
jgi:hypothetical protein